MSFHSQSSEGGLDPEVAVLEAGMLTDLGINAEAVRDMQDVIKSSRMCGLDVARVYFYILQGPYASAIPLPIGWTDCIYKHIRYKYKKKMDLYRLEKRLHDTGLRSVTPVFGVAFLAQFLGCTDLMYFILENNQRMEAFIVMTYQLGREWMTATCDSCGGHPEPYPYCTALDGFLNGRCVNCHSTGVENCSCRPVSLGNDNLIAARNQQCLHLGMMVMPFGSD